MLLVVDNIINSSPDTIVMVSGAKFNWLDIADEIEKGRDPFATLSISPTSGAGGYPVGESGRFYVTPLMTSDALKKSSAYARAQALFGQIDVVCSTSWPDGDGSMPWPTMKAGLGAATPAWFGRHPVAPYADWYATNVLVWIIPPGDGQITLTRIEPMTYDHQLYQGPITPPFKPIGPITPIKPGQPLPPGPLGPTINLKLSDKVTVVGPNLPASQAVHPTFLSAVTLSTWIVPKTITAADLHTDIWREFLSTVSYRQVPTPPTLAPPATQTILLPSNMNSAGRDFTGHPTRAIPSSPCIHFDLIVGAQVLPICRGATTYSRAELIFDQIQRQKAVDDGRRKLMNSFAWAFNALLGLVDWTEPELGMAINLVIDISNPPD